MRKILSLVLVLVLICSLGGCREEVGDAKPVIYLYPEEVTDVSVTLDYSGWLTTTYPAHYDGWQVTACPDGPVEVEPQEFAPFEHLGFTVVGWGGCKVK